MHHTTTITAKHSLHRCESSSNVEFPSRNKSHLLTTPSSAAPKVHLCNAKKPHEEKLLKELQKTLWNETERSKKQCFSRALWIHSVFSRFRCVLLIEAARRYRQLVKVENTRQRKSRSNREEEALPWWVRALFANLTNLTRTLQTFSTKLWKIYIAELAMRKILNGIGYWI